MKLTVRIFALSIVCAGIAAASFSSNRAQTIPSYLSATAHMPVPTCGPYMPGCFVQKSR